MAHLELGRAWLGGAYACVAADPARGEHCFEVAAALGGPDALYEAGEIYLDQGNTARARGSSASFPSMAARKT